MIKQISRMYLLLLARKRLAESSWIEMTPDELSAFFLTRAKGSVVRAMRDLQIAMEHIEEWQELVVEIRWANFYADEARREREQADEL